MDLLRLARSQPNVVYDPAKMTCTIWRHRAVGGGRAAALVFESGYLSVNGSRTAAQARRSVRQFARLLQKSGTAGWSRSLRWCGRLQKIRIQAISGTCRLPLHMVPDMGLLVATMGAQYELEIFTAATLR